MHRIAFIILEMTYKDSECVGWRTLGIVVSFPVASFNDGKSKFKNTNSGNVSLHGVPILMRIPFICRGQAARVRHIGRHDNRRLSTRIIVQIKFNEGRSAFAEAGII
jgi:hypothetical protein